MPQIDLERSRRQSGKEDSVILSLQYLQPRLKINNSPSTCDTIMIMVHVAQAGFSREVKICEDGIVVRYQKRPIATVRRMQHTRQASG